MELGRALQFVYDVGDKSKEGGGVGRVLELMLVSYRPLESNQINNGRANQGHASSVAAGHLCN